MFIRFFRSVGLREAISPPVSPRFKIKWAGTETKQHHKRKCIWHCLCTFFVTLQIWYLPFDVHLRIRDSLSRTRSEDSIPSRYPIFTDGRTVGFVDNSVVTPVRSSWLALVPSEETGTAFLPRSDSGLRWYDDTLRTCTHGSATVVDNFRHPHQKETRHFSRRH